MRYITRLPFVLVLFCGTTLVQAQVEIVHKPDYKTGEVIRTVAEQHFEQSLVLAGMNVDTRMENHSATRETVQDKTPEGKIPLRGEFEYFIVNITTPVGEYAFDSGDPDKQNTVPGLESLDDLFRAVAGSKWVAVLNDKPEVESIEFEGEPFEKLEGPTKNEVSPERFKREYNILLARLPDGPVSQGDKWKRTEEIQLGQGQQLRFEKEFEYLGTETKNGTTYDKIGIRAVSIEYSIGAGSPLPLKLDSSELKVDSSEGTLLVDRAARAIVSTNETARITGTLNFSIEVNGQKQKIPGELDLKMTSKSTFERK